MNPNLSVQTIETVPKSWQRVGRRLASVLESISTLPHRFGSLEFATPVILSKSESVSSDVLHWASHGGAEAWLKRRRDEYLIGLRLDSVDLTGSLAFWAIVDPNGECKLQVGGLVVLRRHGNSVVSRVVSTAGASIPRDAICVIVPVGLNGAADSVVKSALAKGFADSGSDHDRDAWSAWLWRSVAHGHLTATYATTLAKKVLGPRARDLRVTEELRGEEGLKALAIAGVFERGSDFVLPSGLHAAVHVNLTVACGYPHLLRMLSGEAKRKLDDLDYNAIVSTGWTVASIARRVIRLRPMTAAGRVRLYEYEGVPLIPITPVQKGARAIVITDVVVTGELIKHAVKAIEAVGGYVVGILSVIDSSSRHIQNALPGYRAMWRYDIEAVRPENCSRCSKLEQRVFNPVTCSMTQRQPPRSPAEFLMEDPAAAEFWKQINAAGAYEHHRIERTGGNEATHYAPFVNVERLMAHKTIGPGIISTLKMHVSETVGIPEVILIPGRRRARLLATKLLQAMSSHRRLWLPDIVAAKEVEGTFRIKSNETAQMRDASVLILDSGASRGTTLDELYDLAKTARARRVGAVVIVSRMSEAQEDALKLRFEGSYRRLYQLPIRARKYRDSERHLCPVCRDREEIRSAAAKSKLRPIVALQRDMRARCHRKSGVSPEQRLMSAVQSQMNLIGVDSLLSYCRRSVASGVVLHSLHAARNNGMAPLALPEICDESIPAANRSAMLEYLDEAAWTWSSEYLLPDTKRLLDQRDPDDIWMACAGFLNKSSELYWIEALERRLLSSETARCHAPKRVWNRVAFEVYRLLEQEPSYSEELVRRFHGMRSACRHTPVEESLSDVVSVIERSIKTMAGLERDAKTQL